MQKLNNQFKFFMIKEKELLIEKISCYIYNYIKNDQYINQEFIYNIINIIIDIRKLNNYVKNIIICNNPLIYAEYNFFEEEKNIKINIINIINNISKNYKNYSNEKIKMIIIYEILEICFHETEHANQLKICNEIDNTLENYILKISTIYKCSMEELEQEIINQCYCHYRDTRVFANNQINTAIDEKLYYVKPDERLAEVKGHIITLNIFDNIFKNISYIKNIGINSIYNTILYGYDIYKIPFKEYMIKFNPFISFNEILDKTKTLNYIEKSVYGLEINKEEIELIASNKIKIKK